MTNLILGLALGSPCITGGISAPAGYAFVTTQNGTRYVTTNNGANRVVVKVS